MAFFSLSAGRAAEQLLSKLHKGINKSLHTPARTSGCPAPALSQLAEPLSSATDVKTTPGKVSHHDQLPLAIQLLIQLCEQEGLEVLPDDIAALIMQYQDNSMNVKSALSYLLPQMVASLWLEVDLDQDNHAEALEALIEATQQPLNIDEIDSYKDPDTQRVSIQFRLDNKPTCWTFHEPDKRLAENFIRASVKLVGQRAQGQFCPLKPVDGYQRLLFLPDSLNNRILRCYQRL